MERQDAEITPETCGAICHWMERALLRLGVPPTYVTYHAEYVLTVTGRMVLCTVAVLPHPSLPGFKGEVCYSAALTVATALDDACRQALGCLLTQYRTSFESRTLRLLPRDYWRLAQLMDEVPWYEGIQDDVDAAPFRDSDETLVEMASYLVDLDKYTRRLEDESRTLFGQIRDATVDARQYQPRCVQLERENSTLRYCIRQLEQSLDRATTVLLQSERERVDTREEMLHIKEDLRRLTASQNRLKDKLERKDDLLTVHAHLLGCERLKVEKLEKSWADNVTNLAWLTRPTVYLRNKAERLRRTWEDADSLRVDELFELNGELPPKLSVRSTPRPSSYTSPASSFTCARWLDCRPPSRPRRFERLTPWCPGSFRRTTQLRTATPPHTRRRALSRELSEGMT
jgi:hypothetical protein